MLWQFPLEGHLLNVFFCFQGIMKVSKINIAHASKIDRMKVMKETLNYLYERVGWVMGDWGLYFKEKVKLR